MVCVCEGGVSGVRTCVGASVSLRSYLESLSATALLEYFQSSRSLAPRCAALVAQRILHCEPRSEPASCASLTENEPATRKCQSGTPGTR